MSATFKNAKKKVSQVELRKFMREHKKGLQEVKKIESPLAKYNEHGQLTCILCKSLVRSEAVWSVHVNAKQHKQNIEIAKKLKEKTNNFTTPLKRPLTPPLPDIPEKKPKSILKNSKSRQVSNEDAAKKNGEALPSDFFDNRIGTADGKGGVQLKLKPETSKESDMDVEKGDEAAETLPEGFFDDPKLDAKARNQEYKDPVEEEWEKFVKEIKEADTESAAIIAEDQEESTTERQIDEIDEQMKKLNRVLDLEKKKEEVVAVASESKKDRSSDSDEDLPDDVDFVEFLDWRSKKSFK